MIVSWSDEYTEQQRLSPTAPLAKAVEALFDGLDEVVRPHVITFEYHDTVPYQRVHYRQEQ